VSGRAVRVGVVGKGGVGKTTVAALLATALGRRGARVLAVDTDSNPNLGLSLGLTLEETDAIPELPPHTITGSREDERAPGDLIREYGRLTPAGVTLLTALRVARAGAGCTCGGHATVRTLLGDAIVDEADVAVVDMEAGLEHLSRSGGTLAHADVLLVVVEPSRKSVVTAARTAALADELGIPEVWVVGNKARTEDDVVFLRRATADQGLRLLAVLPYAEAVRTADRGGEAVTEIDTSLVAELDRIIAGLDALTRGDEPVAVG
jgi:CO dehydrogenase maturation factor